MYKIRREWTLREIDLDPSILTSRYALLRWFSLSLGLVNPNDTREGILHLLDALFTYWFSRGKNPTFDDIKVFVGRKYVSKGKRPPSDEAIRHHLRRMIKMGLIERYKGEYVLSKDPLRPEDPASAIDYLYREVERSKELVKTGFQHLKNLYT